MYNANVNGIPAESPPLPGYTGYDCSEYMCPYGNNMNQYRYNSQTLNAGLYQFHSTNAGTVYIESVCVYVCGFIGDYEYLHSMYLTM